MELDSYLLKVLLHKSIKNRTQNCNFYIISYKVTVKKSNTWLMILVPVDIGRKLNVLCTCTLPPVSTGVGSFHVKP